MANYRGHLVGGFVGGLAYTLLVMWLPLAQMAEYAQVLSGVEPIALVFVIAMLFGLFPDVDTNSKTQDLFFWLAFPTDIYLIWKGKLQMAAYLGLIAMLPVIGHHRGWTHARWAPWVVPLPILIVPYLYNDRMLPMSVVFYGAAVVGYYSHLLLDGLLTRYIRVRG
ncbi:metal-dependent hydrolase [Candidatus Saccharibacteria bacterium]|nr:metal-dependent hydrolase [Candidatus Saccharibacteria bacterium]